ncbi:MAG: hypothetical protein ACR2RD_06705, partial [Woeseiaceae bacterium]
MLRSLFLMAAAAVPLTSAADNSEIDEVVVPATRRAISSEEISSGLTLIDRESVESQKLVTDAL